MEGTVRLAVNALVLSERESPAEMHPNHYVQGMVMPTVSKLQMVRATEPAITSVRATKRVAWRLSLCCLLSSLGSGA